MEYTLHNDFSELNAQEWNDLLKESVSDTPFLRHEYQRGWWEHRGGGEWQNAQLILISAREDGKLIGIAPLFIAEYEGKPALLLIGSIEISDYLDVIVRMDDHSRFITGLLDFLASSFADNWSSLDWYNLPDSSPTLAAFKAESESRGWTHLEEMYRPTPRIALNGDFEEYLSRVEKKQRHEIRRKMRRAIESERGVRWFISDMADPEAEIDSFLKLMEQDQGKASFLRDPCARKCGMSSARRMRTAGCGWPSSKRMVNALRRRSTLITKINSGATTPASTAILWICLPAGCCSASFCSGVVKTDGTNSISCAATKIINIASAL
jgi:hypothetical protein